MKITIVLLAVFLSTALASGQRRIAELDPRHAAALKAFLSSNKNYGFLSEDVLGPKYLKEMRKSFRAIRPYYNTGDYNADGVIDFAIILSRKGERKDKGEGMAATHRYDHPISVVIFNGDRRGRFKKVFIEDIEAPLVCFLNTDTFKRKKKLYFGVFETDSDTRIFSPSGKGYIVKYPDEP
jgi:hypothetical protein